MYVSTISKLDRASVLQADQAARAMLALGIGWGDCVGIWASARHEVFVTELAAGRVGARLSMIDPACGTEELQAQLAADGVSLLLLGRREDAMHLRMVVDALHGSPRLRRVFVYEDDWAGFLARGHEISEDQLAAA